MQDVKVYGAAVLGTIAPGANVFMDTLSPLMELLVHCGQVGIAVVTILYIYRKWKNLGKAKKDDDNDLV